MDIVFLQPFRAPAKDDYGDSHRNKVSLSNTRTLVSEPAVLEMLRWWVHGSESGDTTEVRCAPNG